MVHFHWGLENIKLHFTSFSSDRIFQTLEEVKAEQRSIKKMLQDKCQHNHGNNTVLYDDLFPIKSIEELNELERKLQETAFQQNMVNDSMIYFVLILWIVSSLSTNY